MRLSRPHRVRPPDARISWPSPSTPANNAPRLQRNPMCCSAPRGGLKNESAANSGITFHPLTPQMASALQGQTASGASENHEGGAGSVLVHFPRQHCQVKLAGLFIEDQSARTQANSGGREKRFSTSAGLLMFLFVCLFVFTLCGNDTDS